MNHISRRLFACLCMPNLYTHTVYYNVRLFVYCSNNLAKDSFFSSAAAAAATAAAPINQAKVTRLKNITPYILML